MEKQNNKKYMREKIFIDITSSCNHNCIYCFYYRNFERLDQIQYLSKDQLTEIVEKISNYAIEKNAEIDIVISGGEPFVNKENLFYFISKLRQKNNIFNIGINTNAVLLNENDLDLLKKYKVGLFISVPVFNEKLYEQITRSNNYSLLIKNIKLMVEKKCSFVANVVVSPLNIDYLKETYYNFAMLGGYSLTFTHVNYNKNSFKIADTTQYPNNLSLTKQDRYKMLEIYKELSTENLIDNFKASTYIESCYYHMSQTDTIFNCPTASNIIFIDSFGNIKPCGHNPFDQASFGNIFKESLEQCINTAKNYKICNTCKLPKECEYCVLKNVCNGGCCHSNYDDKEKTLQRNINVYDEQSFMKFCSLIKNGKELTNNCKYIIDKLIPPWEYVKNKW